MPKDAPRTILVDTFKDECEEALRVAGVLGQEMGGVRLDTPSERGGVTDDLVKEVRARLDMSRFNHVKIFVSGGLTPERMTQLAAVGADAFGVGSYISCLLYTSVLPLGRLDAAQFFRTQRRGSDLTALEKLHP